MRRSSSKYRDSLFKLLENQKEVIYVGEGHRLAHYYKLDKNLVGAEFDSAFGDVLNQCEAWHRGLQDSPKRAKGLYEYDVARSLCR